MEIISQSPQPIISCYSSISKTNKVQAELYEVFSPNSSYVTGKNLQSYVFEESSPNNFDGSFSFTVKEDENVGDLFMDKVQPLDVIVISEDGGKTYSFIGVVTSVSIGCVASNLQKVVTVSGKSIAYLFKYLNINTDIKTVSFNSNNKQLIWDLAKKQGEEAIKISEIAQKSFDVFIRATTANKNISNFLVGELITLWYGSNFLDVSDVTFYYPISSNMFTSGSITYIDYIHKLMPSPIYEVYGIVKNNIPKLRIREVPFDLPHAKNPINPVCLKDFTLTRNCEEVYTAFMPYLEGSPQSPSFYMNLSTGQSVEEKGYECAKTNNDKVAKYGFQLLTCSFVGFSPNGNLDTKKMSELSDKMNRWYSRLDEMYNGDITIVNYLSHTHSKVGEWISMCGGEFYVTKATHSWNFGDNPSINYEITRGGVYSTTGEFSPIKKISASYQEFVK